MAQIHDVIIDFTTVCKTIYDFFKCNIKNCQIEFFIDMLRRYFKREASVKIRKYFLSIVLHGTNTSFFCWKDIMIMKNI